MFEVARHAWFSEGSAAKYVCMYCWLILTILFRNGDGENWTQLNCNLNWNGKPENATKFELQWEKINKRIYDALFVACVALSIGCENSLQEIMNWLSRQK